MYTRVYHIPVIQLDSSKICRRGSRTKGSKYILSSLDDKGRETLDDCWVSVDAKILVVLFVTGNTLDLIWGRKHLSVSEMCLYKGFFSHRGLDVGLFAFFAFFY